MNDERLWTSYTRGLRLQQRSELTIRNYSKSMRLLKAYLQATPLVDATRYDIEGFLEQRLQNAQPSTVHGDYVNLRAYFNWLLEEEFISVSPMVRVKAPTVEDKSPRVLSDDELGLLFKACHGPKFYDKRDEAMLRLMSEIGAPRRAELANLILTDIDFRHDLVHLTGKTGERWIPYGAKTGVALDKYLRMRDKSRHADNPALWLSYRGAVPIQTVWWIVKRRAAQAGIGDVHPHTLRHTAAHRAMEAGMSNLDMETLFGWSPGSAMTRVYGRATRVIRAQNSARKLQLGDQL